MSRAIAALDLQVDLYRFWTGPNGRALMEGAARATEMDPQLERVGALSPERMRRTSEIETAKLRRAQPYWVSFDMVELSLHAALLMEPETLEDADLPAPAGLVLLERPTLGIFRTDVEAAAALDVPEDPPLACFSWGLTAGVVQLAEYTVTAAIEPESSAWPRVMLLDQHDWPLGTSAPSGYAAFHCFAKAFWALCQQKIGKATTVPAGRGARRRAERAGLELVGAQEVVLRRRHSTSAGAAEGDGPEWSCRWVVDGHWRQQWYPSVGRHRQIWIEAYEKGPEDAPLKLKDRVYRFSR